MAATAVVIILLPLFFTLSGCNEQDSHALLLKVVNAIEKLVKYFKASYQDMNLDGVFGLKVLEGQMQRILDEHGRGQHASLSPTVVHRLQVILKDAKWVGDRAVSAAKADDEQYFTDLQYVISQPWAHLKRHRRVEPTSRWEIPIYQAAKGTDLNEGQSDACMMEIMTPNKSDSTKPGCSFTDKCGGIMTQRGLTEYGITHQILWSALAEKAGCSKEVDELLKGLGFQSVDHMQLEFCTNNYYEMIAIVHVYMLGRVKGDYQDLFLEQQFVCPSLGFFEFLKKEYLDQVLAWQMPSGCFGEGSEKDDAPAKPGQAPLNLPPKMVLSKLNTLDKLKNVSQMGQLDQKQQQMQQELKGLKANNKLLQSVLQNRKQAENGDQLDQLHRGLEALNREGNVVPMNQAAGGQPARPAGGRVEVHPADTQLLYRRKMPQPGGNLVANPFDGGNGLLGDVANSNRLQDNEAHRLQGDRLQANVQNRRGEDIARPQANILDNLVQAKQILNQNAQAAQSLQKQRGVVPAGKSIRGRVKVNRVEDEDTRGLPGHPVIPGVLGNRLQGRRMLSTYETGQATRRKLLVEKEMPGGCLAHKSGVASGALVMYLRYLIDPGPLDLFSPHDFFPNSPRGLLGNEESLNKVMTFLSKQQQNTFVKEGDDDDDDDVDDDEGFNAVQPGGVLELNGNAYAKENNVIVDAAGDEEEEDEDEDGEYADGDEMYPDTGGGVGQQQQQHERRVVHFGAHDEAGYQDHKKEDYNDKKENGNDEYANEDEEDEEIGADYIKRGKDDGEGAANDKDDTGLDDDTEYTYYDDNDNTEQGIIRRHKPPAPPQNGPRIRTHNRHKPQPPVIDSVVMGQSDSPPTKMVVLLLSATSIVLMIFMYRFIRKRRIHIRHHNRGFFRL